MGRAASLYERFSNKGRWGADDERGSLNLISPDVVLRGILSVRHGRVVSMARGLQPGDRLAPPALLSQRMLYQQHEPSAALDAVEIAPHGFEITHVDALSHVYLNGEVYNGRRAADVVTPSGVVFGDVAALAGGIVTRGVLLDVARFRSVDHLEPTDVVTAADLDGAERQSGVQMMPGDALILHTGIERQSSADRLSSMQRTGVDLSCVAWMHQRDVAVYAGDCIEALPSADGLEMPLHMLGLAQMGLILVDAPVVEDLVRASQELAQTDFLFVCAPLPIRGGSGSAANPLAIF